MNLVDIKTGIEKNTLTDGVWIFNLNNNSEFLANQYINAISKTKNIPIEIIEEINDTSSTIDVFNDTEIALVLRVLFLDNLIISNDSTYLLNEKNLIIIVKSNITYDKNILKEIKTEFEKIAINIPILIEWQVIDYIMSSAEGITETQAKWLYDTCNGNIDRINQELFKLTIFSPQEMPYVFTTFAEDNIFSASAHTKVFDFSHALSTKNIKLLKEAYNDIEIHFPNPAEACMKFIGLIYHEFKYITLYQTSSNPTPNNSGIPEKQFTVFAKKPRIYTQKQLAKIFGFLSDMDRKIKMGEFPTEYTIDYIILKILNM